MNTIDASRLESRLRNEKPDNFSADNGFALVSVLSPDDFSSEHIPGSINIPEGSQSEFEACFGKNKEIIVYCASEHCPLSGRTAKDLTARGFTNVVEFPGGMEAWRTRGNQIESGKSSVQEMSIS